MFKPSPNEKKSRSESKSDKWFVVVRTLLHWLLWLANGNWKYSKPNQSLNIREKFRGKRSFEVKGGKYMVRIGGTTKKVSTLMIFRDIQVGFKKGLLYFVEAGFDYLLSRGANLAWKKRSSRQLCQACRHCPRTPWLKHNKGRAPQALWIINRSSGWTEKHKGRSVS